MMLTNLLNFIFNFYLGRKLNFEQYGIVTLINTVWLLLGVIAISLAQSVNHRTSFLALRFDPQTATTFFRATKRKIIIAGTVISLLWLICVPGLTAYFQLPSSKPLLIFTPIILFGYLAAIEKGFMQGNIAFKALSAVLIGEALFKIVIAVIFVQAGQPGLAYLSIISSVVFSFLIAVSFSYRYKKSNAIPDISASKFPNRFMLAALISSISLTAFVSIDILLSKHYLSPKLAGEYAVLSLIGKMIFYFGSLFNVFIITFVGRSEAKGEKTNPIFLRFFIATATICALGAGTLIVFGHTILPLIFGPKALAVVNYLPEYAAAIGIFTASTSIVYYRLAKKQYVFSAVALIFTIALAVGIMLEHGSIADIIRVVLLTAIYQFLALLALHIWTEQGRFFLPFLLDLRDLFLPLPEVVPPGQKRILIFNWRDLEHVHGGGAEVYVHELGRRWVAEGHKVTLFCGNDGTAKRNDVVDGIEVIRRGGFYFVYAWAFLYYIVKFRGNYDVILDCHNGIPFFAPLYAKEPVYCISFHVHQAIFKKHLRAPQATLAAFLEKYGMRWAYRNTRYIAISQSTKTDMLELGLGQKGIEIIHSGVDLETLTPGPKSLNPTILYVGRLKRYKSVDVLIKAFVKVLKESPDATLIIAGAGDERSRLEILAGELNVANYVEFVGKVTEEAKIKLYQQAWVFVNPSQMEGWGITTIEANACGTPVVASNVPGLRDSVQDLKAGYLVEYGDVDAFATKISQLIGRPHELKEMSESSVHWANGFSWDTSAVKSLEYLL